MQPMTICTRSTLKKEVYQMEFHPFLVYTGTSFSFLFFSWPLFCYFSFFLKMKIAFKYSMIKERLENDVYLTGLSA